MASRSGSGTGLTGDAVTHSPATGLWEAVRRVQREVTDVTRLLRQATEFHQAWMALSESSLAGYTASGDPAPVGRDYSRIAVKG